MLRHRPLLVIEDSDDDFELLESCLRTAHLSNQLIRCASASQISSYLEQVKTAPIGERPVFVFLDLNLPGIHGLDVLRDLKSHPTLSTTPVVVLTTSTQPRDVEQSYQLGAGGFLTKPVDLDQFETMVQQVADYWFSCVQLPENVSIR